MKNLLSILSLVVIFFVTTSVIAQDSEDKQEKEQKQIKNEAKTATMTQTKEQNQIKNETKAATKTQTKGQHRVGFIDEDGDGVNDNTGMDKDDDGITFGDRTMIPRAWVKKIQKI